MVERTAKLVITVQAVMLLLWMITMMMLPSSYAATTSSSNSDNHHSAARSSISMASDILLVRDEYATSGSIIANRMTTTTSSSSSTTNHVAAGDQVGAALAAAGGGGREEEEMTVLMFYNYSLGVYNTTLQDPRLDVETLFTSAAGLGIVSTTATLSTISSLVIIYIMSRSSVGIRTVYHRLMVGVSIADILQSFAMALTTLPMPTDMVYEQFEGLVVGTKKSCNIQGTVYMCGFLAGTCYNIFLTFYYLCAITFSMQDATFRKYFERTLHGLAITFSLIVSYASSNLKQIHPSPLYAFCVPTAYPYWCTTEEDCLSGGIWKGKVTVLWFVSSMIGVVGILFLVIIICSVYIREKRIRSYMKSEFSHDNEENQIARQQVWNDFTYTISVAKQSLFYVMAYVAVYIFPVIQTTSDVTGETLPSNISSPFFQVAYVLLRPSQGTLNLMIFLHHKIWKLQKQNPAVSFSEALKSILLKGDRVQDKAISSVEIVMRDHARAEDSEEFLDEEEEEESCFDEFPIGVVNEDKAELTLDLGENPAEAPSAGTKVKDRSLGSSWMGLSLSAKDGSLQISSHGSLISGSVSLQDDSSSVDMTKSDAESQQDN
jgi:hypothetical protein